MKLSTLFSRKPSPKPVEQLAVQNLTFVGEQDGPSEKMLKGKLSELFAERANLLRAYLARVHYGDEGVRSVCLCLAVSGGDEKPLVHAVHSVFAQHFNRACHLDILFLKPKQENQLAVVCKPFYRRAPRQISAYTATSDKSAYRNRPTTAASQYLRSTPTTLP
jgi:hypothetical protein